MPDEKIKLPRSSYEELCKIMRAYGRLQEAASLDEVSKSCAMNKTAISANNSFLANVGLIEGGKSKLATSRGQALARALEHRIPEVVQEEWARVVKDNDFLDKMAAAVKIRGKMDGSALEAHIAYSAGEAKSKPVMTGARAVVDILRAAGVVREQDGQLVASGVPSAPTGADEDRSQEVLAPRTEHPMAHVAVPQPTRAPVAITMKIELRIDAKPGELEGLGTRIRGLIQDLHAEYDVALGPGDENS